MAKIITCAEDLEPFPELENEAEPSSFQETIVMDDWSSGRYIEFEVRAEMDDQHERVLKRDLRTLLDEYSGIEDRPEKVIISRVTSHPRDERVIAVVESGSGAYLGSITIEANGMGALFFNPPTF